MSAGQYASGAVHSASRALFLFYLGRGLLALGFGLFALFAPSATGKTIVVVFGIFCILDGIIALVTGYILRGAQWSWVTTAGVLGIVLGLIVVIWPATAAKAVILVIAVWALVVGAFQAKGSFDLKGRGDSGWFWNLLGGLVIIALGLVVMFNSATALKTLVVILGVFAVVYGVLQLISAVRARRLPANLLGD